VKKDLRKTSIICTIGPATEYRVDELIKAGMGVARINFSHGGKEEQQEKVERIKKVREEMGAPLAIMLDTQGPEIRLGRFSKDIDEKQHIEEGMEIILTNDDRLADGKYFAVSYKDLWKDVKEGSTILIDDGAQRIKIIAKIENQEGIQNIESIIKAADGVMVARGDLAVEIPFEEVPYYQKRMIQTAKRLGKPVIVATQMLESMSSNPNPTRAEVSDVANAVYDITSGIMLSGETAAGKYPVECVKAMDKIAKNAESNIHYWKRMKLDEADYTTVDDKIAYIIVNSAQKIKADAIVTYTKTGNSVARIAGLGAGCPILAITDDKKTYNQLALTWNVTPLYVESKETITKTTEEGIRIFKEKGIIEEGDILYLAGGREFISGVQLSKRIGGIVIA